MTKTERIINFLTAGLKKTEIPTNTRKYRKFTGRNENHFYFVGRSGGVRSGRIASDSISITDLICKNMAMWEKKGNLLNTNMEERT